MGTFRKHNRTICDVKVTRLESFYVWGLYGRSYKWCAVGFLEDVTDPKNPMRLGMFRKVEMAVAFTVGLWIGAKAWIRDDPIIKTATTAKEPSATAGQEQHGSL